MDSFNFLELYNRYIKERLTINAGECKETRENSNDLVKLSRHFVI